MYSSLTKVIQIVASVQTPSCVILFSFYTIIFLQRSYDFIPILRFRACARTLLPGYQSLPLIVPLAALSSGDFCQTQMEWEYRQSQITISSNTWVNQAVNQWYRVIHVSLEGASWFRAPSKRIFLV